MNIKLERMWKELIVVWFRNYHATCMEALRKITKTLVVLSDLRAEIWTGNLHSKKHETINSIATSGSHISQRFSFRSYILSMYKKIKWLPNTSISFRDFEGFTSFEPFFHHPEYRQFFFFLEFRMYVCMYVCMYCRVFARQRHSN
jgi:hypothetical protein